MASVKFYDNGSGQYVPVSADGPPGPAGPAGPDGADGVKAEVAVGVGTPSGGKVWGNAGRVRYLSSPGVWTDAPDFGGERVTGAADGTAATDGATKQQVDELKQYDSGWITVTSMSGGWVNYGSGWPPLQYRRTNEGVVHITGLIKNGSGNIFTLPVGFWPSPSGGLGRLIFLQMCYNDAQARVDVTADGVVTCGWLQSGNAWLSIHLSFYTAPIQPGPAAPTNFRATNLGAATNSVNLAWDARSGATAYKVYYQTTGGMVHHGTTSSLSYTVGGMSNHTNHSFFLEAVDGNGNVSTTPAGPVKVRSGAPGSTVAAGTGIVGGGAHSVNRWRQNQWGYGGSNQPYIGWYTNEAYRYHGFIEIPDWLLRNAIFAAYPQLNGHHHSVACTSAGLFMTRNNTVGNYNNQYTLQTSLGNGISYANTAEPPEQVNIFDITMREQGAGQIRYPMPWNWFQAIYQNHASYNGFLFRPYRNGGGRQQYMAINTNISWDMHLSWGNITTGTPTYTKAW